MLAAGYAFAGGAAVHSAGPVSLQFHLRFEGCFHRRERREILAGFRIAALDVRAIVI